MHKKCFLRVEFENYLKGNVLKYSYYKIPEGANLVNKRVRVLIAVISIVIVLIFGGIVFVSWHSEQVSENLKGYSARLEEDGFTVESQELSKTSSDIKKEWQFFSDFSSYAKQMNVTRIYFDHDITGLYFLTPVSSVNVELETNIFYYNKVF